MARKVNVMECIGTPSAITQELGDLLYGEIVKSIDASEKIILDFSDIESMITPFLNNAIGKLYGRYSGEIIAKYLEIINMPKEKVSTVNMVISNAKKFYSNRDEYQKAIKDVIG